MTEDARTIWDPRGLIREAYRIEGITEPDCRSIFLDWALGLKEGQAAPEGARALLASYADAPPDHPMTRVLQASLDAVQSPRRRGGASGRR